MTSTTASRVAGNAQALPLLFASCMSVLGAVLLTPVIPQLLGAFGAYPPEMVLLIISAPALMIAIFAPFAGQIAVAHQGVLHDEVDVGADHSPDPPGRDDDRPDVDVRVSLGHHDGQAAPEPFGALGHVADHPSPHQSRLGEVLEDLLPVLPHDPTDRPGEGPRRAVLDAVTGVDQGPAQPQPGAGDEPFQGLHGRHSPPGLVGRHHRLRDPEPLSECGLGQAGHQSSTADDRASSP